MANTKQSKKRILVNNKKRVRNLAIRSALKTFLKKAKTAIDKKEGQENCETQVKNAVIALDKAACKGIIHKNTAARRKSRLMKFYNKSMAVAK